MVHKALETGYRPSVVDEKTAIVHAMLVNYTPVFGERVEKEKQFSIKLPNKRGVVLSGKIDRIVDGTVVEHKTTSSDISPVSFYWRKLALDIQVSAYLYATNTRTCVYDVLRKPALRMKKDETFEQYANRIDAAIRDDPTKYYQQAEVTRSHEFICGFVADLADVADEIRREERCGRFVCNPSACDLFGRPCEYHGCCAGYADIDDDDKFRTCSQHEELKNATTPVSA
jgi:hypothetical protein